MTSDDQILLFTERTFVKPLQRNDSSFIYKLVNSPGWIKFIGDRKVSSESDALNYIRRILDNPEIIYWVVRLKDSKTPAGIITFIKRDYLEFHDLGFAFLPEFANQGFALESASAILNKILIPIHPVILATTIPDNTTSIKLLKKLGFTFEKEIVHNSETLHVFRIAS